MIEIKRKLWLIQYGIEIPEQEIKKIYEEYGETYVPEEDTYTINGQNPWKIHHSPYGVTYFNGSNVKKGTIGQIQNIKIASGSQNYLRSFHQQLGYRQDLKTLKLKKKGRR